MKSAGAVEIFAVTSGPYPEFTLYGYGPGGALALDAVWLDSLQVERLRPDFNHPTSKLIEVVFGYEQVSLPLDIDELDWTFELKGDQFGVPVAL